MAVNHLSTHFLNEITHRLVTALEPEQIFLFGSYAYGEPTEDSDIDLLVIISKSDEPRYRRARHAYKALRGIGIPKDILVMTRSEVELKASVANSLVNQIIRQGKLLYVGIMPANPNMIAKTSQANLNFLFIHKSHLRYS